MKKSFLLLTVLVSLFSFFACSDDETVEPLHPISSELMDIIGNEGVTQIMACLDEGPCYGPEPTYAFVGNHFIRVGNFTFNLNTLLRFDIGEDDGIVILRLIFP